MTSGTASAPLGARRAPGAASAVRARLAEAVPVGVQVGLDTLGTPVGDIQWIVVDLETTGLGADAAITEIGAVRVRGGRNVDEFQSLVDPGQPIPPRITALTGITPSMVADAPRIEQVYPRFARWAGLEGEDGRRPGGPDAVLVAHNASFDMGFLRRAARRCGRDWPAPRVVDTLALARVAVPRPVVANHRLGTLAAHFGASAQQSHRALDDARATVGVLMGLLRLLAPLGATTLEDIGTVGAPVPARRRRRVAMADSLPRTPGAYRFVDVSGAPLYVGSATNLRSRVRSYFTASETRRGVRRMLDLAADVVVQPTSTTLEARVAELRDIRALRPMFNSASTRQDTTHWVVCSGGAVDVVPVLAQDRSGPALGPFGGRGRASRAREAILEALAPPGSGPASALGEDALREADEALRARSVRVADALSAHMSEASDAEDFEAAARWRELLASYLDGVRRRESVLPVASARRAVWARRLRDGGWALHASSWGRLTRTVVTPPGTSPAPWAEAILADPPLPRPEVFLARTTWEEARLLSEDLLREGSRLVHWDGEVALADPVGSPLSRTRLLGALGLGPRR
ncbi:exonuclease domain-containing protein [Schaalia naturae]|uniref:Exonuclease domain-containing protein n=1 Tax=Schaalia naturae TaxID=635203 RepID=A0ABW2SKH3_9ACTO